MPTVLFLRSSRQIGGIERQMLWHARRLQHAGWGVHMACLYRGDGEHPLAQAARAEGLEASTLSDPSPWSLKPGRKLRHLLAELQPNIIHTADYRSDALVAMMRKRPAWMAETQGHTHESPRMRLWNWLDVWALRRAEAVAPGSTAWETWLAARGIPPARLTALENSRAILLPGPLPFPAQLPGPGPHLLYAGRLSPEKGVDLLLDAWPAICRHHPEAQLWVLGHEAGSARYRRRIAAGLQQPGVNYLGHQPDIRPWLQAVDAVVVPSRREAWGMTAFEALCMGTRLVAARVGGLPGVCRGAEHARLFTADDANALTSAIDAVLTPGFPRGPELGRAYCSQPRFDPQRRHRILLTIYAGMI